MRYVVSTLKGIGFRVGTCTKLNLGQFYSYKKSTRTHEDRYMGC